MAKKEKQALERSPAGGPNRVGLEIIEESFKENEEAGIEETSMRPKQGRPFRPRIFFCCLLLGIPPLIYFYLELAESSGSSFTIGTAVPAVLGGICICVAVLCLPSSGLSRGSGAGGTGGGDGGGDGGGGGCGGGGCGGGN